MLYGRKPSLPSYRWLDCSCRLQTPRRVNTVVIATPIPSAVGMKEGGTTTPIMTDDDGIMTGGDLIIMIATIIHPALQSVRTMIVLTIVGILGGRFSLIVNNLGKVVLSPNERGLQWVCWKR